MDYGQKSGSGQAVRQDFDFISALGRYHGERELKEFLASLGVEGEPVLEDDYSTFLHNHELGIELTFKPKESLRVPLREYPKGALVLYNIRFYGVHAGPFQPYSGKLLFGLKFGALKQSVIGQLGPPDSETAALPIPDSELNRVRSMRWDRDRYALFATLSEEDRLAVFSLQLPIVAAERSGHPK
jgi:hypothetical protein